MCASTVFTSDSAARYISSWVQPVRPARIRIGRLLTGDVQGRRPLCPPVRHLEQQCRLADAGITGEQAHRTRHDTPAQNPVVL